jgi:2-oxoglutarate ferredoxin oxidoreductase subunit alpha
MTAPAASRAAPARILMKGNEAMAEAAIQAGCDAYFGYPITPQAELLEWMARRMPEEGRVFVQAESEIGAINMALGAAATGARVLVSTSGPGFSLMAEGMSYIAGSELPVVLIDVMRGGPGLGSIGPSQSDYLQATRGHGHGDYRVPVLAPTSISEAVALTADAFELAERYRTPVIILADGVLGQAMEPVVPVFRTPAREPAIAEWAAAGADGRAPRAIHSLHLKPEDLEAHNRHLQGKFAAIERREVRWAEEWLDDAEVVIVAYGTAARVAETAIERAREHGMRVGLVRPITLWPFPAEAVRRAASDARAVVVVEMSAGQLAEDVRLAVDGTAPILVHGRMGGMVPTPGEVVDAVRRAWARTAPVAGGPREMVAIHIEAESELDREPDPVSLIEDAAWAAETGRPLHDPEDEADPLCLLAHGNPEAVR